jgi:hypothetical protein
MNNYNNEYKINNNTNKDIFNEKQKFSIKEQKKKIENFVKKNNENYQSIYNYKNENENIKKNNENKNENKNWTILNREIISYQYDLDSYNRDFNQLRILNCKSTKNFFDYFKDEYCFKNYSNKERERMGEKEKNSIEIFKELDEYMGWSKFYLNQLKLFHRLNELEKEFYLIKYYKKYNLLYDEKFSYRQSFDYLSYTFRIKDKFENFFMQLGHFKKGIFNFI